MKFIKRILILILLVAGGLFLHYNLPHHDVVQIVGTDVKRIDIKKGSFGWGRPDAGTDQFDTRDVRFINTVRANGKPSVYRNEDTDWGWPPYFKFDTGNLTAEAQDIAKKDDMWVAVRHYGWRIPIWSIYPNAVSVKVVDGPKTRIIPWFNIIFLIVLFLIILWILLRIRRFKINRVDPIADKIEDAAGAAQDDINETRSAIGKRFRKWFGTGKSKK